MDYNKVYKQLISKAQTEDRFRNSDTYYERHHILPKCLGGSNTKSNLVLLTAKEHYLAHYLLHREYPADKKLLHAFMLMCFCEGKDQFRHKVSSRTYEYARKAYADSRKGTLLSDETKYKISQSQKGKILSEQHKAAIGDSLKGRVPWNKNKQRPPFTEEWKLKLSKAKKGTTLSEGTRHKMIKSRTGVKRGPYKIKAL